MSTHSDFTVDALRVVLDRFSSLGISWKVLTQHRGRPLYCLVLAPKRYVLFTLADDGVSLGEVVAFSEHALAGQVEDPPGLPGRGPDGRRRWTRAVAERAVIRALHEHFAPMVPFLATRHPWEIDGAEDFASIRWGRVGTPADLDHLVHTGLGLRPGSLYLETTVDRSLAPSSPVLRARDPGTNLFDWPLLDWRTPDGHHRQPTTDPANIDGVLVQSLARKGQAWSIRRPETGGDIVHVVPKRIRRVGRAGSVIDAQLDDPDIDVETVRVVHDAGNDAAWVAGEARRMGPRAFARRTGIAPKTAERAALGRPLRARTVRRALAALGRPQKRRTCSLLGCDEPVARPNAVYCSRAHTDAAYRARRRSQA